jgi:hypothetical protein
MKNTHKKAAKVNWAAAAKKAWMTRRANARKSSRKNKA